MELYAQSNDAQSHDYLGRSAARGSFMVWTHNMKNITYDSTFVPQGAPATEIYEGRRIRNLL